MSVPTLFAKTVKKRRQSLPDRRQNPAEFVPGICRYVARSGSSF